MLRIVICSVLLIILICSLSESENFQMSGGIDGRYKNVNGNKNNVELEGLFLNLRKVLSDKKGDRLIMVGQLDIDNNFKEIKPYQTYIQYKGPLGKWNIRAGHYILPFGLLFDYDTERIVLQSLENLSLGIKLDTGIEVFGYIEDFDYAISISQGVGRNRLADVDNDKLTTLRIGWQDEEINIGLSGLIGKVLTEEDSIIRKDIGSDTLYERRLGIDITKYIEQLILRGELLIGKDNEETVEGILLKTDYALTQELELNIKYANWQRKGNRNFIGVGFSYEVYKGLFFRIADEYQFGKEYENVATFQIYYEFINQF